LGYLKLAQFESKALQGGGTIILKVQALQALLSKHTGESGGGGYICGRKCLMITPEAYEFCIVNFHVPDWT
jgi:hypothetical protein